MKDKINIRINTNPIYKEGYNQNYYLFFCPKYKKDRELVKYSSFIGFLTLEDMLNFCQTFKNEKELLNWHYGTSCEYIYDILGDELEKYLTIKAFSQEKEIIKINYEKKEQSTKNKPINKYPKKVKTKRRNNTDWGIGARSSN